MRFIMFRTPKPKEFKYTPRYYDEKKERLERRKAELGMKSELTERERLRAEISGKWKRRNTNEGASSLTKIVYYLFYAFVIIGGIYVIFFTNSVDKLVALFGVGVSH